MSTANDEPQLAHPVPIALRKTSLVAPAFLLFGLIVGGTYAATDSRTMLAPKVPSGPEDLSANIVTLISSDDRPGIAAAVAALNVSPPQRAEIQQAVAERRRQLGWIVFVDSMDPDGDTVAVEASGLTQQVVLTKHWTPVAVAVADGTPIGVTAIRDGQGGGITVAFATRLGAMPIRIMRPGERIEVVP